ncbi:BF3164 family lipoprotein [Parabacteroides goldsteinii]
MKKIALLLFVIIIMSCTEKSSTIRKVTEFPDTKELTWDSYNIPNPILLPRAMFTSGKYLIVYKQKDNFLFDIFTLEPFEYLFSAGIKGSGPDDFGALDSRSFIPQKDGFSVLESGSHILKRIEITDDNLKTVSAEKIFDQHSASNGFYPLTNNKYLMFGNIEDSNEYYLFDSKNKSMNKFGEYPEWTKDFKSFEKFLLGIKNCVVHPNGKMFAAFYGRMKHIKIYNDNAVLLHDISVNISPYTKEISNLNPEELATFYLSPQSTSKYIYVLCSNKKSEKIAAPTQELQVWDWNGNPVMCYKLNKPVSLITISELDNKIYAIDQENENQIYTHELPL